MRKEHDPNLNFFKLCKCNNEEDEEHEEDIFLYE